MIESLVRGFYNLFGIEILRDKEFCLVFKKGWKDFRKIWLINFDLVGKNLDGINLSGVNLNKVNFSEVFLIKV